MNTEILLECVRWSSVDVLTSVGRWPGDQYRRGNYDSTETARDSGAPLTTAVNDVQLITLWPRHAVACRLCVHVTSRQLISSAPDTPPNHSVVVSSYNLGSMILTFFFLFRFSFLSTEQLASTICVGWNVNEISRWRNPIRYCFRNY